MWKRRLWYKRYFVSLRCNLSFQNDDSLSVVHVLTDVLFDRLTAIESRPLTRFLLEMTYDNEKSKFNFILRSDDQKKSHEHRQYEVAVEKQQFNTASTELPPHVIQH